jgi:hypothetical protein
VTRWRWLRHRTVTAAGVCLAAWLAWSAWQDAAAPGRIGPALRAALAAGKPVDRVTVELGFTPSDFHMTYLQRFGSLAGVQGRRLTLFQVRPADIRRLAHVFWIRRLDTPGNP